MLPSRHPRETVCVVSFHPLLFSTIRGLLAERDFELEEYRASPDASEKRPEAAIPHASVYIVEASPQRSATEHAIEKITSRYPSPRFLVVGERFDESNAFPLLRLGIKGLVTYADAAAQIERAVDAVSRGGFWLPRAILSGFVEAAVTEGGRKPAPGAIAGLTRREQQVLNGLLENLSNKEIASTLGITERGVKFHVSNLLSKHHVRRRSDLILFFLTSR